MRPLRLHVEGFTAFRDRVEIDFDGLDLFAISGQTGSGKSSLLDAVTYALFGYVERVGKQVGQLVAQGQKRMAVMLEFAVGNERFRVTRSTPATTGATKILLERRDGDEWRQAGEGADRVREANAMIREAVGLDFEAFTRSVLLPQGRFAEFLVGDAKDRRSILTELLGLELFERLAKRAGEARRDATSRAEMNERLLETEYAGVTVEAVREAEVAAKEASARDAALAEGESVVRAIADRWAATARSVTELVACAADARKAAEVARDAARSAEELAARIAEADARARESAEAAGATSKEAGRTGRALAKAEADWGRARDLTALRVKAESLAEHRDEIAEAEAELKAARQAVPRAVSALAAAERTMSGRVTDAETAIEALEAAREAVDEATHADLVAALRAGAHVGEVCPVCGNTIGELPRTRAVQTVEKAKGAHAKAERAAAAAKDALDDARTARDAAESEVRDVERDHARIEKQLDKLRAEFTRAREELAGSFGGRLPRDAMATIDERLDRLEELEGGVRDTEAAAAAAKEAAAGAKQDLAGLVAEAGELRGRVEGLSASGIVARARSLSGDDLAIREPPRVAGARDAATLVAVSAELGEGLASLAVDLDGLASSRAEGEGVLLEQARSVVGDLVPDAASLSELVDRLADTRTEATKAAATAEHRAHELRTKLENAGRIVEEIAAQRDREARFEALSKELRADRIIAFLQLEALQVLAAAGSNHLSTLSADRYRLAYDEDEFFVVDTWNGEETRSARTLSGGETFLASLALALALSEQVRSLAVTDKATLESLFLDEGFGTLDPETLETVVEAIEVLGGDGRMVGVITHVQELALRLPVRIEVEKSPRGSRVTMVRG